MWVLKAQMVFDHVLTLVGRVSWLDGGLENALASPPVIGRTENAQTYLSQRSHLALLPHRGR